MFAVPAMVSRGLAHLVSRWRRPWSQAPGMKRVRALAVLAVALSAGGVIAATQLTLDLRPYSDAPAANHANRFDGFGYLQSALLDRVADDVDAARAAGSTRPVSELAAVAWRGVTESPSTWHPFCVCVVEEGCPCKTFKDIFSDWPPEELDADVHDLVAQVPATRPTRTQILDAVRANRTISNLAAVTRGYDDTMAQVEAVARGARSPAAFYRDLAVREQQWTAALRGDDRDFLLQGAAMARNLVQYADNTSGVQLAARWVDCAFLGAAVGCWPGSVVFGGGCAVNNVPWYPIP